MKMTYDIFNRTEPSVIYLAKPGQRLIGALAGIREDTCNCEVNLNNTCVLEFDIDRDLSGEINPYYDLVDQHYELYVTHVGWFKINEEPIIENDGDVEFKSVRAESLEIELQQYDLVNFYINTGEVGSKEMLATDNTYMVDDYTMFRDQVKFWRDTSDHEALSQAFKDSGGSTVADLEALLYQYPGMLSSWRIDFDYDTFDAAINSTINEYEQSGKSTDVLSGYIGKVKSKNVATTLTNVYPELLKYTHIIVDQTNPNSDQDYTIQEVIDLEIARQNELSFLWLVLHEHGWTVGFVDDFTDPLSPTVADHEFLKDRVGRFEVETQDIYSFLTQEAAGYFRCIFDFDTDNYKVNAYKVENIGYDTNICISFHSIENSVTRSSDEQLRTVVHVKGSEDLDFTEVNFGEDWIEDISYFLDADEKHFPAELKAKYKNWYDYREEQRPTYIQLSKDYRNKIDEADEIYNRVPLDGADTTQYSTFSDDELVEEKAKYQALIRGYESRYVDEDGEFDIDFMRENAPYDYANYILINDQIIPNIDIAIYNRGVDAERDEREYLDGYRYDFNTYGKSYGVAELQTQLTTIGNSVKSLARRGYDKPGEQGDEYWAEQYALWQKYSQAYSECEAALEERTAEYNAVMDEITSISNQMNTIKENVAKTNPRFEFTARELWILDKYYIHTDYVNENILVTSVSTNNEIVDTEYQLYLDAKDELYVLAHPQYVFQTTQDNLLIIPEFQGWHKDLDVGNFIRVTLREDYQVKLRITTISFNPFLIEPTIDLTFSNMIQYRAKRNDFAHLLDSASSSGKNQISQRVGTTSSRNNDINIDPALILKLINNDTFSSYMSTYAGETQSAVIGNVTATTINAVQGRISQLVSDQIDAAYINVDHIVGTTAEFQQLFSDYIGADYLVAEMLRADEANIRDLTAEVIRVGTDSITTIANGAITTAQINADQITGTDADFQNLTTTVLRVGRDNITTIAEGTITTEKIVAELVKATDVQAESVAAKIVTSDSVIAGLVNAQQGDFDALTANTAFIEYLNSGVIDVGTVNADAVITALLQATQADVERLDAQNAFIDYLNSNLIIASEIQVDDLKAKLATITVADIEDMHVEHGFVESLQSLVSTTATATINDAYIYNAVAGKITVADLDTHSATAEQITLISQDGNPSIAFSGSTQQFYDSNGNVRVQIGQDGNGDFNFIVRGADGTTALFNENGITQSGIPNSTIVNNMIHDSTIEKGKLNFPIVDANPDGTINITQIKDGTGGDFGVEYTTFKQNTSDAIDDINSKKMYRVVIESDNGNIFKNGDVNCTLRCRVYSWDDDVTDDINAAYFTWTRKSKNAADDTRWNTNHSGGTKTLTITPSDVYGRSVFYCTVTLPDGSTVTGN